MWVGLDRASAINLAAIANAKHAHHDSAVQNVANHAPITDTVLPITAQPSARKGLTDAARVIQRCQAIAQKCHQPDLYWPIQLFELFQCVRVKLNLPWQIEFDPDALKELKKLDRPVQIRLVAFLRDRLAPLDDPRSIGEALSGARLGSYWKYRVGDWRMVCDILDRRIVVRVLRIGNRREVYR